MKMEKYQEGKVLFWVPKIEQKKRRETKKVPVFYNPEMELSRDISVCALQVFREKQGIKINGCDCLAATGIRGLRYAKEVSGVKSFVLNDKNPRAANLIRKNIIENKLKEKCIASCKDANILLRESVFNFIDIDPFGSPNIFLDSAARSIWHRGFLALTATDTAPLSGTYPLTCLKKYGILSMKTPFYAELGIRILLTYTILTLSRYRRVFLPVLSYAMSHYFRIFGKIEHACAFKKLLQNFGYVMYCKKCGAYFCGELKLKCNCNANLNFCGLIYLGEIQDANFVKAINRNLKKRNFRLAREELKLLGTICEEACAPPFYYDLHDIAKKHKIKLIKLEEVIKKLKKKGFYASRTHFSPTSVKTNAPLKKILGILH